MLNFWAGREACILGRLSVASKGLSWGGAAMCWRARLGEFRRAGATRIGPHRMWGGGGSEYTKVVARGWGDWQRFFVGGGMNLRDGGHRFKTGSFRQADRSHLVEIGKT